MAYAIVWFKVLNNETIIIYVIFVNINYIYIAAKIFQFSQLGY